MIGIRHIGMVLMDGGIGTTAAVIHNIVLALIAYPECQKKAHEEIDRVVGSARMPTLADYDDLPYLQAFVKEVCSSFSEVPALQS